MPNNNVRVYAQLLDYFKATYNITYCNDRSCDNTTHIPILSSYANSFESFAIYGYDHRWYSVTLRIADLHEHSVRHFGPVTPDGEIQPLLSYLETGELVWNLVPTDLPPECIYSLISGILAEAIPWVIKQRKKLFAKKANIELISKLTIEFKNIHINLSNEALNQVDLLKNELYEAQQTLITKMRQFSDAEKVAKQYRADERRTNVTAERDAKLLVSLIPDRIKKIELGIESLNIYTQHISIYFQDENHDLGYYKITIPTTYNASYMGIRVFNIDGPPQGGYSYQHPHVNGDGECCLGNLHEDLFNMMKDGKYAQVGMLMVNFLESYNDDNPYYRLGTNWDDCLNDGGDCIHCYEDACLYWEERFYRCWERIQDYGDLSHCISCGECDYAEEAMMQCHSQKVYDKTHIDCIDKCNISSCDYWQDENVCRETNSALCLDCRVTECSNYEPIEEEEETNEDQDIPY